MNIILDFADIRRNTLIAYSFGILLILCLDLTLRNSEKKSAK